MNRVVGAGEARVERDLRYVWQSVAERRLRLGASQEANVRKSTMKVWIETVDGQCRGVNEYAAFRGFEQLGAEVGFILHGCGTP